MSCGDVNAKKMLQNEDDKIRNAIDRLGMSQPSIGTKISSWWQGVSRAFSSSASRAALQINTVIDRAFTPEPEPVLVAPVQLNMNDRQLVREASLVNVHNGSPLARQESFIVPSPSCDCQFQIPNCPPPKCDCTGIETNDLGTACATANACSTATACATATVTACDVDETASTDSASGSASAEKEPDSEKNDTMI